MDGTLDFECSHLGGHFNPIPTSQGRNQPLYECHVTKSGWNRVKSQEFFSKGNSK